MRVFGINSINATRTAKAEYVLPVPMGSPQNYYGVGLFTRAEERGAGWDRLVEPRPCGRQ